MIPSLLLIWLRHYRKQHPDKAKALFKQLGFAARVALLLAVTLLLVFYAVSQERILQYIVKRGDNRLGNLVVQENKQGHQITYKLQSLIETGFPFTVSVKAQEEAVYKNGVLTYSRFYQKVNDNERVNTEIHMDGKGYRIISKTTTKPLDKYPITYNMICLYTVEPLHHKHIFSDRFGEFLPVKTLGLHHYKITFPDGNYNEYYYKGGLCTRVKLNTTWFSAEMELKN